MLTAVGCAPNGQHPSTTDAAAPPDVAAAALRSAVEVVATGCGPQPNRGLGGSLDPTAVVTAAHTVAGSSSVVVGYSDGTTVPATVVMLDPELDVALVRTAESGSSRPARLADAPAVGSTGVIAVRPDDDVAGHAELTTQTIEVLRPVTIHTTDIYRERDVVRPGFELAAVVRDGDSGTLVHVGSAAIGIVWARSTRSAERAWAVALPERIIETTTRDELIAPVDTGACV